jgi:dienelactone hydrolase
MALEGWERGEHSSDGTTRTVWRRGTGPAVIVMAEIPGITPKVVAFADRVVALGASVALPSLFGEDGAEPNPVRMLRSIVPACVNKEFRALAVGVTTPVAGWLRDLARTEHERCGGPGVGAVGMCFTGGFALSMMLDDRMLAPVLSQPSLPISLPLRKGDSADLHLSPDDLATVKQRAADGTDVLGLRFTGDPLCPPARFDSLRRELGDSFIGVEIDSSKGNPHGNRRLAHSVLTEDLVDEPGHPTREALDQVLAFLAERLGLSA